MYEIPTTIIFENGDAIPIRNRGDFRMVLDCFEALDDAELDLKERLFSSLIIFYEPLQSIFDLDILPDIEEAVKKMFQFFNCGEENTKTSGKKLIDWKKDSQLISSAINKVAGKEIRFEPYIHWWTFSGYYMAIDDSPISTIIQIRNKLMTGEKLEKHEVKFRRMYPDYFIWNNKSVEDKELDALVNQLWNSTDEE